MESHSDLPPATGPYALITKDTVNNSAQFNHLPYDLMRRAAIAAMKERGGSSRQAIAIEREYKSLSLNHSTLLTWKLRKMMSQGQLVMNKYSYMISQFENCQ